MPVTATATPAPRFDGVEFSPADLIKAGRADLRQAVRLSGGLQPLEQTVVRAEVAALVQDVLIRRGETVKKGQVLARLDTRDLAARLRERESNLASARSSLQLAETNRGKAVQLNQRGVKSQAAVDDAENAYNTARANVSAYEQQVIMARKALSDAVIAAPIAPARRTRSHTTWVPSIAFRRSADAPAASPPTRYSVRSGSS